MESANPNSVVELQNVDEVVELPANQTEDQEQADDQSNVNFLYTPSEMLQKRQRLWSEFSYKLKSIQADQIDVAKFVKFASDDDCPDDARRQHRLENLHRFFRCIVRGSDCIDKAELQHRVLQLTEDDIEDKCCIVFDMFDADNVSTANADVDVNGHDDDVGTGRLAQSIGVIRGGVGHAAAVQPVRRR